MRKLGLICGLFIFSMVLMTSCGKSSNEKVTEETSVQVEEPVNKVIKKETEKTGDETLIKEYDEQGNLIKITQKACLDCSTYEFDFKDGKVISAKTTSELCGSKSINKQKNIVVFNCDSAGEVFGFNEFGINKQETQYFDALSSCSYEYNENGFLVKSVSVTEDGLEGTSTKMTISYTYDVMNQDWTTRTGSDEQGNEIVTTRTVEYW